MNKYRAAYFFLFNRITDALRAMERRDFEAARTFLLCAQTDAEEIIVSERTN